MLHCCTLYWRKHTTYWTHINTNACSVCSHHRQCILTRKDALCRVSHLDFTARTKHFQLCTHTSNNRCRERNLVIFKCMIEVKNKSHTVLRFFCKHNHRNQHECLLRHLKHDISLHIMKKVLGT